MSSKEQYYSPGNVGKRRGSPEENSLSFEGQGGRIVLPPISLLSTSSFPGPSSYDTQYAQPRSSPSRFMLNNSFYTQWPNSNNSLSLPESTFVPNYEPQDRYGVQSSYPTYVPPRLSPPILQGPTDSRRLPSLSTTSAAGGDRWQQSLPSNCATAGIRSPTASYPTYASYPSGGGAYTYLPANNLDMNTGLFDLEPQVRPSSPGLYRTPVVDSSSTSPAPPISPTTTAEQPNIKPKRQRATEEQRSILEETWKRTPFPSTEERNALAKRTGMPQRRIQIWFQNKRQGVRSSQRQCSNTHSNSTNAHRHCSNAHSNSATAHTHSAHTQSTTTPSHCHTPYSVTPPATTHCPSRRHGPINSSTEPMYITPSLDQARSSSPHHQLPSQDDSMEPLKWPSRGF